MGSLMRLLGGIPVNRQKSVGFVERTVELIAGSERIMLVIAPEGTRKNVDRWRTGFYHIAVGAGVPIVPAYIDWTSRTAGFGDIFSPTGNADSDIAKLRAFYESFGGRNE